MNTADWALAISILSFVVALGGFIWNVWSKFIYPKPRVRVKCAFVHIIELGRPETNDAVSLIAVNHGPIDVTLRTSLLVKRNWFGVSTGYGILKPLFNYPAEKRTLGPSTGFPKKLAVGEQFSVLFIPNHSSIASDEWSQIGFDDTFGRIHYARRRDLKETRRHVSEYIEKHGAESQDD